MTEMTDTPATDVITPPRIPGWRPLLGQHSPSFVLPEGQPFLAWFPDKDWDGNPWYYAPDRYADAPLSETDPQHSDTQLKLQVYATHPDLEQAKAAYAWITA